MADTIASLIDKLGICNSKLFAVQDLVHKAVAGGVGLDADTTKKLVALNLQRNSLMSEIDATFAEAIKTGIVATDPRVKIL